MRIGFVGSGKVGTALAVALATKGYFIRAAASRSLASSDGLALKVNEVSPARCAVVGTPQEVANLCDLVFVTDTTVRRGNQKIDPVAVVSEIILVGIGVAAMALITADRNAGKLIRQ